MHFKASCRYQEHITTNHNRIHIHRDFLVLLKWAILFPVTGPLHFLLSFPGMLFYQIFECIHIQQIFIDHCVLFPNFIQVCTQSHSLGKAFPDHPQLEKHQLPNHSETFSCFILHSMYHSLILHVYMHAHTCTCSFKLFYCQSFLLTCQLH